MVWSVSGCVRTGAGQQVREWRKRLERRVDVRVHLLALPDWQVLDGHPGAAGSGRVDRADERVELRPGIANEMRREQTEARVELATICRTAATSAMIEARSVPLP